MVLSLPVVSWVSAEGSRRDYCESHCDVNASPVGACVHVVGGLITITAVQPEHAINTSEPQDWVMDFSCCS